VAIKVRRPTHLRHRKEETPPWHYDLGHRNTWSLRAFNRGWTFRASAARRRPAQERLLPRAAISTRERAMITAEPAFLIDRRIPTLTRQPRNAIGRASEAIHPSKD
jgi:hypothetical protein